MNDDRKVWTEPELKQQSTSATDQLAGASSDGTVEASGGSVG